MDLAQWPLRKELMGQPGLLCAATFGRWFVDAFRFLAVLSVQPRKNLPILLDAYLEEFSPDERVTLWIKAFVAGWGADPIPLVRHRFGRDAPGCVVVTEPMAPQAIRSLYHAADAVVSVSVEEGWGWTGLESIASGVQTILTDGPGHREYATADACRLIPTRAVRMSDLPEIMAETRAHGLTPNAARHIRCGQPELGDVKRALRAAYEQGSVLTAAQRKAQKEIRDRFTTRHTAEVFLAALSKRGLV